jgi:uncharacterized Fe-S center protein
MIRSKVYFIKAGINDGAKVISEKACRLFKKGQFSKCFKKGDFTAVKVHVGEPPNNTYIKADYLKGLVKELLLLKTKPFLTDTSTLYTGRRCNAVDHAILASEHGFDIAGLGIPFIPPDGLFGTSEAAVRIDAELNKEVFIASDILRCQSLLSIAHLTGHIAVCMGATLKTLGMGLASRKGKMRQHSALKPRIKNSACTGCGECIRYCLQKAIIKSGKKAHIVQNKCVGCGECAAVCRFGAILDNGAVQSEILQKNIAEHALGAVKGKEGRMAFFNFLLSVTADCDCFGKKNMSKIVKDIGLIASEDPVAVDKASLDMIEQITDKKIGHLIGQDRLSPYYQIEHAEKIGLGSSRYSLIEVG